MADEPTIFPLTADGIKAHSGLSLLLLLLLTDNTSVYLQGVSRLEKRPPSYTPHRLLLCYQMSGNRMLGGRCLTRGSPMQLIPYLLCHFGSIFQPINLSTLFDPIHAKLSYHRLKLTFTSAVAAAPTYGHRSLNLSSAKSTTIEIVEYSHIIPRLIVCPTGTQCRRISTD